MDWFDEKFGILDGNTLMTHEEYLKAKEIFKLAFEWKATQDETLQYTT